MKVGARARNQRSWGLLATLSLIFAPLVPFVPLFAFFSIFLINLHGNALLKDWIKEKNTDLSFFLSEASCKVKERGHLIKVLPTRWKTKGKFRVISFLLPFYDAHSQSTVWLGVGAVKDGGQLHVYRTANEWVKTTKPHRQRFRGLSKWNVNGRFYTRGRIIRPDG